MIQTIFWLFFLDFNLFHYFSGGLMASIGRVYEPGPYLPQSCQKSKIIWTLPTLMSTQQTLMDLHQVNILTLIYNIYAKDGFKGNDFSISWMIAPLRCFFCVKNDNTKERLLKHSLSNKPKAFNVWAIIKIWLYLVLFEWWIHFLNIY